MSGVAILCSGQGKQDVAMFSRIQQYPEAKALMMRIRETGVLPDAVAAWLDSPAADPELIFRNDIAQPLVCLYQMLIWEIIKPLIPEPDIFAGYSLGELSTYACAGIFRSEELVRLAAIRGRLMTDAANIPQTMAAIIGLKRSQVETICPGFNAEIAIINGADHFIVGLPLEKLAAFISECSKAGAVKTIHLPVSAASHTSFMQSAATEFNKILLTSGFQTVSSGILAGTSGEKVFSREEMVAALTAQIHQTIDWRACMESAVSYGCRVFLEIGPGNSLARMVLESFPGTEARSVSEFHDIYAIKSWLDTALSRQS
jgi:[acyl-carrier-protein] S-malonyltransferase